MSNEQKSQIHKLTEHSGWAGNHFAEKRNGTLPERRQGEMGVSSQYKWFLPPPKKQFPGSEKWPRFQTKYPPDKCLFQGIFLNFLKTGGGGQPAVWMLVLAKKKKVLAGPPPPGGEGPEREVPWCLSQTKVDSSGPKAGKPVPAHRSRPQGL